MELERGGKVKSFRAEGSFPGLEETAKQGWSGFCLIVLPLSLAQVVTV